MNNISLLTREISNLLPICLSWKGLDGVYLGCNEDHAEMLGINSKEEIIGKKDIDFLKEKHAAQVKNNDEIVISTQKEIIVEEPFFFGKNVKHVFCKKLPVKEEGNIVAIVTVYVNFEFYKRREQEFISVFPGHLYWRDKEGFYLGCNQELAEFLGLNSPEEIVGKKIEELDWNQSFKKMDLEVMQTGKTMEAEEEIIMPSNEKRVFLSRKVPLYVRGEVIGLLGTSIDITERKEKELLIISASKAKSEFIANMSHDFRTALSGIIGLTEILQQEVDNAEHKDLIKDINSSGNSLLKLFSEIIELAKITNYDAGKQREVFSIKQMVTDVLALVKPALIQKEIVLVQKSSLPYGDLVKGHYIITSRIFLNILSNAIKFTPAQGKIIVKVNQTISMTGDIVLNVSVEDNGIGISAEGIKTIFEPFKRLIPSYKGTYKGAGIGLYICRQLAQTISGSINVTSEEGQGCEFIASLPVAALRDQQQRVFNKPLDEGKVGTTPEKLKQTLKTTPQLQGLGNTNQSNTKNSTASDNFVEPDKAEKVLPQKRRVLLVEDSKIAQVVGKKAMLGLGCTLDIAETSEEAITLFTKNHYDFVWMDIGLPDRTGDETATLMRNIEQNQKRMHTPIVAITAHVQANEKQRYLDAGIDDVRAKPLSEEVAREVLARYTD